MAYTFDASGKIKQPSAEDLAAADEQVSILAYTSGMTEDGRPYYAYVKVKPSKYREFHTISASGGMRRIADYGTVIAADYLPEPPPAVAEWMREEYGFDDEFEEALKKEALAEQAAFFDKKEEKRINDIVAMLKLKAGNGGGTQ